MFICSIKKNLFASDMHLFCKCIAPEKCRWAGIDKHTYHSDQFWDQVQDRKNRFAWNIHIYTTFILSLRKTSKLYEMNACFEFWANNVWKISFRMVCKLIRLDWFILYYNPFFREKVTNSLTYSFIECEKAK